MTDKAAKGYKDKRSTSKKISNERWLAMQFITLIRQFGSTFIWASVLCYLIHDAAETIQAFAGRTSIANFALALAAHLNATVVGSLTLSGVTSGLWLLEFRRHRKTRERLTSRITQLEKVRDPKRESSKLTSEGTTRFGDL